MTRRAADPVPASPVDGWADVAAGAEPVSPRERILRAAAVRFDTQGVRNTGIDAIIESAAVAKATFYRHFPSKDELIVAWLNDPRTRWFAPVHAEARRRTGGSAGLTSMLFDVVAEWQEAVAYRGCPYLNVAAQLPNAAHPARAVAAAYVREVRAALRASLGPDGAISDAIAGQIQALLAGALTLGVVTRSTRPLREAGHAAEQLLAPTRGQGNAHGAELLP